ncbi:MAG: iron-containing alcohol dehydrogenase [Verrucomicrobiae bacterium]|nr:iron-containing alcohol dehydrogenase [Verrucomicrobiae bacterium]
MITANDEHLREWTEAVRLMNFEGPVFAIVDPVVEEQFGITGALEAALDACAVTTFCEFQPNPCWDSLSNALGKARAAGARSVIAIGGGTAIDLGKLTSVALQEGCGLESIQQAMEAGQELVCDRQGIRLMAIPTTPGTGAEATRFAVLYRDGIKYSITGTALLPDGSVLDPSLLRSLPSTVIADAGLDAACQAMESLWSVRTTSESERFAWRALDLAVAHLESAVKLGDRDSLSGMLVAAHFAGKAINLTTTTAPHALSYGLTSLLGMPHGRAVAFLFGEIFKCTVELQPADCSHPGGIPFVSHRLQEIAVKWGQTTASFPEWWSGFLRESLAISEALPPESPGLVDSLIATVNVQRLSNHPCVLTPKAIAAVYHRLIPTHPAS